MRARSQNTCKNCGNPLKIGSVDFCSKACLEAFKSKDKPKQGKTDDVWRAYQFEREALENSIGCRVELQMSRGPPIKGILRALDLQYAKVAVEEDLGEFSRIQIVKLGYVATFSVFKPKTSRRLKGAQKCG